MNMHYVPPEQQEVKVQFYLDKHGYLNSAPDINVVAVRERDGQNHVSIATVCAKCLSQRASYRRKICSFLKKALSDKCIDNPELRELLFADALGHC